MSARTQVKGLVAKLVHVKQQAATTALEVAAGNKLYQVVVDSEVSTSCSAVASPGWRTAPVGERRPRAAVGVVVRQRCAMAQRGIPSGGKPWCGNR